MTRLPPLRRKERYIVEIDAARKRQKVYEERKDPFCDYDEDVSEQHFDIVETPPSYANKLTTRRYRRVRRKGLTHDLEYYQNASVAMSITQNFPDSSRDSNFYPFHKFGEIPPCNEFDEYRGGEYFEASTSLCEVMPQFPSMRTRNLYSQPKNFEKDNKPSTASVFCRESDNIKNDFSPGQEFVVSDEIGNQVDVFNEEYNESGVSNQLDDHNLVAQTDDDASHEDYFESSSADVQEQVEVVDDDDNMCMDKMLLDDAERMERLEPANHHNSFLHMPQQRQQQCAKFAGPIDLHKLFELMTQEGFYSNDQLMEYFFSDPAMGYSLNVVGLIAATRNASPESNAQVIASLAMQINHMKKDMSKLRQDVADLRAVCLSQDNPFLSPGRRFDPMAEVSQDWRIPAIPPLSAVDLVEMARQMGNIRTGKRTIRNEDLIRRFVRIVLLKLVPQHMVRAFTVRDRERARGRYPQDIGDFAKNQITGVVLDLMGLNSINENDSRMRAERAYYFQLTNRLMKCAIYDMRRTTPKKRDL